MDTADFSYKLTFRIGSFRFVEGLRLGGEAKAVETFLVEDPDNLYPHVATTYLPLETETGLFLELSRRGSTKEGIQQFCFDYGPLVQPVAAVRADNGAKWYAVSRFASRSRKALQSRVRVAKRQ
jgi:hypothetical protein